MKRRITLPLFLLFLCFSLNLNAQIDVATATTDAEIETALQSLFGLGVDIDNVVYTAGENCLGSFQSPNWDIQQGLVLSTGNVAEVSNASSFFASSATSEYMNDPDLQMLLDGLPNGAQLSMMDVAMIEFDITALGDQFSFNFVFGSEEYPEFVCSNFNDIMGFFITEAGSDSTAVFSFVPGTDLPVMIGTINNMDCVEPSTSLNCPCYSDYYIDNLDSINIAPAANYITFDGLTTVLPAVSAVMPYQTYRLKIAIADAGDSVFDSAVFVEHGSFYSEGLIIGFATSDESVENNGILALENEGTTNVEIEIGNFPNTTSTLFVEYGGTAESGVHYEELPSEIEIGTGKTNPTLAITPIEEGFYAEQDETLIVYFNELQTGEHQFQLKDSLIITLKAPAAGVFTENIIEQQISIHPNPAKDVLYFSPQKELTAKVITHRLFDLSGRTVLEKTTLNETSSFDISQLENGLFWYVATNESGTTIAQQKVMIME